MKVKIVTLHKYLNRNGISLNSLENCVYTHMVRGQKQGPSNAKHIVIDIDHNVMIMKLPVNVHIEQQPKSAQ